MTCLTGLMIFYSPYRGPRKFLERRSWKIISTKTSPKMKLVHVVSVFLLAALAAAETDFCRQERLKCEKKCKGYATDFDCRDEGGSRSFACACGEEVPEQSAETTEPRGSGAHTRFFGSSSATVCDSSSFLPRRVAEDTFSKLRWGCP